MGNASCDAGVETGRLNPRMTIKDAQEIFQKHGSSFASDYEQLVRVFRHRQIEEPLPNENYLHALSLTDLMLRHTSTEFRMLTGCEGDGFLACLQDSFRQMLIKFRESRNQGKARVIVVDGSTEALASMKEEFSEVLDVVEATADKGATVSHFIVSDADMVRDEQPHGAIGEMADANMIKADVYFANRVKARVFSVTFDRLWKLMSS